MRINQLVRTTILASGLFVTGCQIQHGLDERQANELQKVLRERGFNASKVAEGGKKPSFAIEVEDAISSDATRVLAELGLPRPRQDGFAEVFAKSSIIPSPTEERVLYLHALSGEIARTLESVEGVVSARVHLVVPSPPRVGQLPDLAKAGAFLRIRPGMSPAVLQMKDDLRGMIASSVEGLSVERVNIVVSEVVTSVPNRSAVPIAVPFPWVALGSLLFGCSSLGFGVFLVKARNAQSPSAKPIVRATGTR